MSYLEDYRINVATDLLKDQSVVYRKLQIR